MKPLLAQKIVRVDRGERIREWEPAEHHLTLDGQAAFAARQRARIAAAQQKREEVNRNGKATAQRGKA